MKGCVVHDDQVRASQTWAQPCLEPGVEHVGIARALEENGFSKIRSATRSDERRARSAVPGCQAIHALALGGLPIAANHGRCETTLIDRHKLQAATNIPLTKTQNPSSLQGAAFLVADRFFPGPSHLVERVPDAMTRDAEVPGRFRLRQVVMRRHVTPQRLPIQFMGGFRTRALVCQPTGFEPPVHTRLAHLAPPSGLRLAAAAPHKTHHPPAQIR